MTTTLDLKGFTLVPARGGDFTLCDGDISIKVTSMGGGKFQASWGSASSTPHATAQTAIDWSDNLRSACTVASEKPRRSKGAK